MLGEGVMGYDRFFQAFGMGSKDKRLTLKYNEIKVLNLLNVLKLKTEKVGF